MAEPSFDTTPLSEALVLVRRDGVPHTNVPQWAELHASGFDWGYDGPAPADLALNVIESFVRRMDDIGTGESVECTRGEVDRLTWRLYPYFKAEVVENVPEGGTRIDAAEIRDWVRSHTSASGDEA